MLRLSCAHVREMKVDRFLTFLLLPPPPNQQPTHYLIYVEYLLHQNTFSSKSFALTTPLQTLENDPLLLSESILGVSRAQDAADLAKVLRAAPQERAWIGPRIDEYDQVSL